MSEEARLRALQQYQILDTAPEEAFDKLVNLASYICNAPISLISLLDENRQWFKAKKGLNITETDRELAFCDHAIRDEQLMIVKDASKDERFATNPLVTRDPNIRFYAGIPLITPDKHALGTLCVIDKVPRELTESQQEALSILAEQVMTQLELRRQNWLLQRQYKKELRKKEEIDRLLQERNLLVANLEASNELKDRIFMLIGHDLRNPLNNLSLLLDLVGSNPQKLIERIDFLLNIKKALNAASLTLENLLAWGMAQHDKNILTPKPLPLRPLTEELVEALQQDAGRKQNELIIDIPDSLSVKADPFALKTVMRNLLTNANKFTSRGTIVVSASSSATNTVVEIQDTGLGISSDHMAELFCWTKKVSRKGTSNEKGSGVGLLMSRDLTEMMQGQLSLSSKPGKGTMAAITLPTA